MKKKNILVITNLYPNPEQQNRGVFVSSMVKELAKHCNVCVVTPLPWFPKWRILKGVKRWHLFSKVPAQFKIEQQHVLSPKYLALPKLGFLHPLFLFLSVFSKIRKIINNKNIDLINAHFLYPDGVAASWIGKYFKIPVVLSAHGTDINIYMKMPLRRPQMVQALKVSNAITVVSGQQKGFLELAGIQKEKITVIGNGFNAGFMVRPTKECRSKLGVPLEKKIALFIGRIVKVKGLDILIEAIRQLSSAFKDNWQVVIIGDGKLKNYYIDVIQRYKLENRISFLGEKPHSEIPFWLGASDMVILSSLSEGCPTAVVEALACGRPVIASAVGEVPGLIQNRKNGILFNPGDTRALGEAMIEGFEASWNADEISETVRGMSWRDISRKYLDVFAKAGDGYA